MAKPRGRTPAKGSKPPKKSPFSAFSRKRVTTRKPTSFMTFEARRKLLRSGTFSVSKTLCNSCRVSGRVKYAETSLLNPPSGDFQNSKIFPLVTISTAYLALSRKLISKGFSPAKKRFTIRSKSSEPRGAWCPTFSRKKSKMT